MVDTTSAPDADVGRNRELREELLSMKEHDQAVRSRLMREGVLFEDYAKEMEGVHIDQGVRLGDIIDRYGWPGLSLVGGDGADAAWLVAQHAISSPSLQRRFLRALNEAVVKGDAPREQAAYLHDRILFNEGKPQRYGLVFDWDESGQLSACVDNAHEADLRREHLGLPGIAEATQRHRSEAARAGVTPPASLADHRARTLSWARRVGWR